MKRIKLLAVLPLFYTSLTTAQTLTVQRSEGIFTHGTTGHAHASATMNITFSNFGLAFTKSNTFAPDANESKTYVFTPGIGEPPPTRTFTISMIPGQVSGSYPLPAAVGDQVVVQATDPGMTYVPGGYGYAVYVKCVGTNSYTLKPVRLEMMDPDLPPLVPVQANLVNQEQKAIIYPSPNNGSFHLEYGTVTSESFYIDIVNIEGRTINTFHKELSAGNHKLPLVIQDAPAGMYFVNWRTSTGNSGSLKMIKQ